MTRSRDANLCIAIFVSTSGHSGVDRAMKNLIPALARRGYAVDLLKVRKHGPNLTEIPLGVRVISMAPRCQRSCRLFPAPASPPPVGGKWG